MQHVISQGPKDPETDTITQYNDVSNHVAEWCVLCCMYIDVNLIPRARVVSLILCHDKPRTRSRVIFLFVELASRLRNMNNYSALRAVVAGINHAAYDTDVTMTLFKRKEHRQFKLFQSFDQLLQTTRAHGKYRLALRNSKGACIPAL